MGLSYDFTATGIPADDLYDDDDLRGEFKSLVFLGMAIGLPGITQANVDKFIGRATLYEKIHGPLVYNVADRTSCFDPHVARRCIGLTLNVAPESRATFLANITRGFNL